MRVGYLIEYIENAAIPGVGGISKVVIFLTADSFGILPPINLLSKHAAMYHFVTGFTSKVAGMERRITEPVFTFHFLLFTSPSLWLPVLSRALRTRLKAAAVHGHRRGG